MLPATWYILGPSFRVSNGKKHGYVMKSVWLRKITCKENDKVPSRDLIFILNVLLLEMSPYLLIATMAISFLGAPDESTQRGQFSTRLLVHSRVYIDHIGSWLIPSRSLPKNKSLLVLTKSPCLLGTTFLVPWRLFYSVEFQYFDNLRDDDTHAPPGHRLPLWLTLQEPLSPISPPRRHVSAFVSTLCMCDWAPCAPVDKTCIFV